MSIFLILVCLLGVTIHLLHMEFKQHAHIAYVILFPINFKHTIPLLFGFIDCKHSCLLEKKKVSLENMEII